MRVGEAVARGGAAAAGLLASGGNAALYAVVAYLLTRGGPPSPAAVVLGGLLLCLKAAAVAVGRAAVPGLSARERLDLRESLFVAALRKAREPRPLDHGEAATLLTEGVESLTLYRGLYLPQLVVGIASPLVVGAAIWLVDPPSALVLLGLAPVSPLLVNVLRSRFRQATEGYRARTAELSARFQEGILGLPTLKLFGAGRRFGERIEREADGHRLAAMRLLAANQLLILLMDLASSSATTIAAALLAIARFGAGAVDGAGAFFIVLASLELSRPLQLMGAFFFAGSLGRSALESARAFLGPAPTSPGGPLRRCITARRLRAEGLAFRYPAAEGKSTESILRLPEVVIERGVLAGLHGPSGSGKTTLRRLLCGLLQAEAGSIVVDGEDVTRDPDLLRSLVVVADQHPVVFSGTIRSNLLYADPSADEQRMRAVIASVNLDDLDREVGEEGRLLSGGQRARLAVARALLRDGPFLVLDEPSADLDPATEALVIRTALACRRERGVLLISHRQAALAACDRLFSLAGQGP